MYDDLLLGKRTLDVKSQFEVEFKKMEELMKEKKEISDTSISFLKNIEESNLDEKEIQSLFEKNLDAIEEGLEPVSSFLPIGTGIIDMLAIDEDNNPVIIEFKRLGNFDRDALIQVMNYYSWFVKDGNHRLYINEIIRRFNPEIDEISDDLRLVIIVSNVDEDVMNACWAIDPRVTLVTYSVFKSESGDFYIAPKVILDTFEEEERTINPPKIEDDHFRGKDSMHQVYNVLIQKIKQNIDPNIKPNPSPQYYIGLVNKKNFCGIRPKKQHMYLDLLITPSDVGSSPRVTELKVKWANSKWSKIKISSEKDIDDELLNWIRIAYSKAS